MKQDLSDSSLSDSDSSEESGYKIKIRDKIGAIGKRNGTLSNYVKI